MPTFVGFKKKTKSNAAKAKANAPKVKSNASKY